MPVETSAVWTNLICPWREEASKPGGSSTGEEMRAEKLPKAGWFCVFTMTSTERGYSSLGGAFDCAITSVLTLMNMEQR